MKSTARTMASPRNRRWILEYKDVTVGSYGKKTVAKWSGPVNLEQMKYIANNISLTTYTGRCREVLNS